MAEQLSGGDALIRALQDEGVEYLFGYPGGAALHIYDAIFRQQKMTHILVRHEQAATHMADGYARATGKTGVVVVTSGPGATNAITGIATAYMDSIPMVVISSQVARGNLGTDAFQETDMVGISRPVVKHSFLIKCAEEIPLTVKKAFYIASTGRPGPVVIDVPKDTTDPSVLVDYEYPASVKMRSYNPSLRGHTKQIRKAVDALIRARRPVIYAGGGVVQGGATGLLTEIALQLNAPVTNTLMGLGAFPGSHRQFLGMLGMHGTVEANKAMHYSDVIFAVGARFDDRVTNNAQKFCPDATIIHLDVDPASISKIIHADIPIVGTVDVVLARILELLTSELQKHPELPDQTALDDWWARIEAWRGAYGLDRDPRFGDAERSIILPQDVIRELYRATAGNAYICSDVGQHQMYAAQYYKFNEPRHWINSGGLGTMGFGLPAAMGVKLALPEEHVVCVTGDGSIMMNLQELSTCLQFSLAVKIICLNNGALGMVKQWQDMQYAGRHSHSTTYAKSLPDFAALSESFGHLGFRIDSRKDLAPAIDEMFSEKYAQRLVFLDVHVDPKEHVYPMAIKGGAMREMYLNRSETT